MHPNALPAPPMSRNPRSWRGDPGSAGPLRAVYPIQPGEPSENPEAKRRIKNLLDASGFNQKLLAITPRSASEQDILRVHTQRHLAQVKTLSAGNGGQLGFSAFTGPGGYEIGLLAAGGAMAATDAVLTGKARNAYALVRPPGHHATINGGMGFCLFNNIAIAVRHAQATHGVVRIAVVDWDVHHGNGTQDVFWEDPSVLTLSLHQDGVFPQAGQGMHGAVSECGGGKGYGTAINVPLPAGSGTAAYRAAFDRIERPALDAFKPEMIFVACGLDAANHDALGRMMLGPEDFRWMTAAVMTAVETHCKGRLVLSHEGGYHAPSAPFLAWPIFEQLSGLSSEVANPIAARMAGMPPSTLYAHQEIAIEAARRATPLLSGARA